MASTPKTLLSPNPNDRALHFVVLAACLASAAFGAYWAIEGGLLVDKRSSRFYCSIQSYPQQGGEVWTVMYRHDQGAQPWLKMLSTLGGGWTPDRRCAEIARRLESYRTDGLTELSYRSDPATPKQYVICAKTKVSPSECRLLVTLKPGADPDRAMREMTAALVPGSNFPTRVEGSGKLSPSSVSSSEPLVINLQDYLAEEDRRAGSN